MQRRDKPYTNYKQIQRFGQNNYPDTDPLTYCMENNLGNRFVHGSNTMQYGPDCKECQVFMAQRCANKWDGHCDTFYNTKKHRTPNLVNNPLYDCASSDRSNDILLHNAAFYKYCKIPNENIQYVPFDPNVANSPLIAQPNDQYANAICQLPPNMVSNLTNDPVMNYILTKPREFKPLLQNLAQYTPRFKDTLRNQHNIKL